jgi:hypothetical protein
MNEAYVLRCLAKAIVTKDASFLTSALISLTIAVEHTYHMQVTSDVLLDILVPLLRTKCRPRRLLKALQRVSADGDGDGNGATGYSLCVCQSAAIAAEDAVTVTVTTTTTTHRS